MFPAETRFLIIDDFKTMRSIVRKTLQNLGYTSVDEAEDGLQALELLTQSIKDGKPYRCVISDWNMPKMTGLELLVQVRSNAVTKDLPFILVTAENEQKQVIEAAKAGVSNYIVKPFTGSDFQKKLTMVYQRHHAKAA